jgi:hypothetical protein
MRRNQKDNESDLQSLQQRPQLPDAKSRKKMEELLDRKKNWLFATEVKQESEPSINEMFGVRDFSLDGDDKPKKVMDAFFEEKSRKTTGGKKEGNDDSKMDQFSRKSGRDTSDEEETETNGGGISELNLNRLIHPADNPGANSGGNDLARARLDRLSSGGAFGQVPKDIERVRREEVRSEDFRKLIQPRSTRPSDLGGKMDPINSADGTRREMNPIVGSAPRGVPDNFGSFQPRTDPIRTFNNAIAPTPSALEGFGGHAGSSLSPAVLAPFAPPPMTRPEIKPGAALEFQKRRF